MKTLDIDFLDVRVPLSPSASAAFQSALDAFLESGIDFQKEPRIVKDELRIHSADISTLLGFLDKGAIDEVSLRRTIRRIVECLGDYAAKTLRPEVRSHYQWCLAAVKNFEIGRHLEA